MSLADVIQMPQYKHLRYSNFCDQFKVCDACYLAYQTIDKIRQEVGLVANFLVLPAGKRSREKI